MLVGSSLLDSVLLRRGHRCSTFAMDPAKQADQAAEAAQVRVQSTEQYKQKRIELQGKFTKLLGNFVLQERGISRNFQRIPWNTEHVEEFPNVHESCRIEPD